VVLRCNGQGPASVGDWPVLLGLEDVTELVRAEFSARLGVSASRCR
jgi:hypothetical protein